MCSITLKPDDVDAFDHAIDDDYYFEMFLDSLPVWGYVGEIDEDNFNIYGGSLSIGHPFGATGARMVTTMANELASTGKETALLGICAAGGLGAAAVLEAVD